MECCTLQRVHLAISIAFSNLLQHEFSRYFQCLATKHVGIISRESRATRSNDVYEISFCADWLLDHPPYRICGIRYRYTWYTHEQNIDEISIKCFLSPFNRFSSNAPLPPFPDKKTANERPNVQYSLPLTRYSIKIVGTQGANGCLGLI